MIIIDDGLVLGAVVGRVPERLAGEALATTTTWWWRLLTALRRAAAGSLSRQVFGLEAHERTAAEATVEDLASLIEVPDVRALLPLMADLHRDHRLNLLSAEALAAALALDLPIAVATDNPPLAAAARAVGATYTVITLP